MKFNNSTIFFALLVTIIFIPLYPKFPLLAVNGTYVAIRLEDILIAVVLFLWFLVNLKNIKQILSQTVTQSLFLFWAIGLLSVICGVLITFSVTPSLGILHLLRRVEDMSLFLVAASALKTRAQLKAVLVSMLLVTIIVGLYGFGQIYFKFPVISTTNREYSKGLILTLSAGTRPNSTFAGHYDLAAYLSVAVAFLGSMWFYYKKIWQKAVISLTGLISFVLLGFTAARVSFAAALVGLTVMFWLTGKKILIVLLILASVGVFAAVPELRHRIVATITVNLLNGGGPKYEASPDAVNQFTPIAPEAVGTMDASLESTASATPSAQNVPQDIAPGEPINSTELGVYRSFNIRTNVEWPRAIRAFYKNPFLGTGYSSLNIATDNDFLRALGETGALGALSLLLVFFVIFKRFIKSLKRLEGLEKFFVISSICMAIVIWITGTFIDILEASKIASLLWIFLGLSWAVCSEEYKKNE